MAERMRRISTWSHLEAILANGEEAEKHHVAAFDTATGNLVVCVEGEPTHFAIGYFLDTLTGDGTRTARVELFEEIRLHRFPSAAAPNAVTNAHRGQIVFWGGANTVTADADGGDNAPAGRVYGVTAAGVLIHPAMALGPQGLQGPQGPQGEGG